MKRPSWRALFPFLGLGMGLLALWFLVDVRAAFTALLSADLRYVGLAMLLALNATVIVGGKLWAVVRIVDEPRSYAETWSAVMAGVSLNAVLPGRGGDLVRAVFLTREPGSLPVLLGAVAVERLLDLFCLGLLVLVIAPRLDLITVAALFVIGGAVVGTAALAWFGPTLPWRPELGERVSRAATQVPKRPGYTTLALVLSLLAWANNAAMLVVTLRAVGVTAPWIETYRAAAVGILAGVVPVSVSGIGTRDAVMVLALGPYDQGDAVAAGSFLFTVLMYWFLALVGSIALGRETLNAVKRGTG